MQARRTRALVPSCMSSDKLLNLSVSHLPRLKNGDKFQPVSRYYGITDNVLIKCEEATELVENKIIQMTIRNT